MGEVAWRYSGRVAVVSDDNLETENRFLCRVRDPAGRAGTAAIVVV